MRLLCLFLFTMVTAFFPLPAHPRSIVGWVENVTVYNHIKPFFMKAKIDTGAKTTSIHSDSYTIFKKQGMDWVRFTLTTKNGDTITLEEPVLRYAKIKRHFTESQVRPVIILGLCLGNTYQSTEVNLVDRGRFNYRLLIGRRFLEKGFLVDTSRKFSIEPECQFK